jgi:isopenicillin N synthase-like dioxygenase
MAQRTRGIGAHSDFGALTLLLQDNSMSPVVYTRSLTDLLTVGGLEVFHKPTQSWHSVTPVKDAFVVNIGDMMGE